MKRTTQYVSAVFLACASLAASASTGAKPATTPAAVTCKDGSAGTAGRGACSKHGGVNKKVAAAAPLMCKDGSKSKSKSAKGACSKHGGVATS